MQQVFAERNALLSEVSRLESALAEAKKRLKIDMRREFVCPETGKKVKTQIYSRWLAMRYRCRNSNGINYARYAGRGIRICSAWDDYDVFRAWAVESGFRDGMVLDRIDNNGNYEPGNCQWLTRSENSSKDLQGASNRSAKLTEFQVREIRESTDSMLLLAEKYGMSYSAIRNVKKRKSYRNC